jgi:hypothetical protein
LDREHLLDEAFCGLSMGSWDMHPGWFPLQYVRQKIVARRENDKKNIIFSAVELITIFRILIT